VWDAGIVLWGVVIAGVVLGIRWLVSLGRPARSDTVLEILHQRYARGEIDKQEFEAKTRDLTGPDRPLTLSGNGRCRAIARPRNALPARAARENYPRHDL
jgi:putative membrane protein